jgi:hypothetical protein
VPLLGRMMALTCGDEELARLVVPLLRDTLASQTTGAEAEVGGWVWAPLLWCTLLCIRHNREPCCRYLSAGT